MRSAEPEHMTLHKLIKATPRLSAAIVSAALVLSVPSYAETPASTEDLQATIETLKAALAARDAEIAALKAKSVPPAAAPLVTISEAPKSAPQPVAAQEPEAKAMKDELGDDVVRMSAFEVRTTQGQGYTAGNSASALKTSDSLMKLPAQILVVTSDMVKDIGSHNASDILAFAGLVPYYRGPAILSRGSRIGNPYTDDVPQASGIGQSDNTYIDTYQVIKGPQQVLYPLASLGGLVLQTTKKPLPGVKQFIFDERIMEFGRQSFTFDINHPLGHVGDAQITGRVEGILQSGEGQFYNSLDDRRGIFPNISVDWENTRVVLQYGVEEFRYLPGGTGILTPTGGLYTGLGHRNQMSPPNNNDENEQHDARLSWTQFISDNWQVKTQGAFFNVKRFGSTAFPTTVDWNTNRVTYTVRRNNGFQESLDVQSDVSGKYHFGKFPATSAFGFNLHDQTGISAFWLGTPVTIPIGDAQAIQNIVIPPVDSYTAPANPGTRTKQYVSNAYFMETFDIIPEKLTLAAGFTYSNIETVTDTNLAIRNPYVATNSNANEILHRYAIVYNITKELTLYASESTTFNPAVGVTYENTPLPSVLGKSDEIGVKVSFFDGKLSASAAIYKMELTNQAILAAFPALNIAGLNYYIPIGTTDSEGWDASLSATPLPGLQVVATGYMGTVKDQNGNPITGTVENSWSVFSRYDFSRDTRMKGFAIGGGAYKAGGKWFTMSGLVLPGGVPLPKNSSGNSVFKLDQEVLLNLFASYQLNRNWTFRIDCANVLDEAFPIGAQGVGLVDAVDPQMFSFQVTYKH